MVAEDNNLYFAYKSPLGFFILYIQFTDVFRTFCRYHSRDVHEPQLRRTEALLGVLAQRHGGQNGGPVREIRRSRQPSSAEKLSVH